MDYNGSDSAVCIIVSPDSSAIPRRKYFHDTEFTYIRKSPMPLFTNPVTLNDGTSDHIFALRNDINGMKTGSYGSLWIEPAADQAVASVITSKHDESASAVRRRLFSYRYNALIADGVTYKPITANYSLAHHPEHTDAQLSVADGIIKAGLAAAGFDANFHDGLS